MSPKKVYSIYMDDATYTHLIKKRIHYEKPKREVEPFKSQIVDLTSKLLENKMSGSLQVTFDAYVAECIHHLSQTTEKEKEEIILQSPLPVDTLMYKPKKVNVFLKKKP
jgi:hypothetical protein